MMEARTPFKMQLLQGYVKFWSVGNLTFLHEEKANSAMIYIYFDDKGWACCRYSKQIPWLDLQPKIPRMMEWPSKVMFWTCFLVSYPKWVYSMFISYYRFRFFCGGKLPLYIVYMYNMYSLYTIGTDVAWCTVCVCDTCSPEFAVPTLLSIDPKEKTNQ